MKTSLLETLVFIIYDFITSTAVLLQNHVSAAYFEDIRNLRGRFGYFYSTQKKNLNYNLAY